jgi:hypothetical protein
MTVKVLTSGRLSSCGPSLNRVAERVADAFRRASRLSEV